MTLNEIAYENALELIETTADRNGYPSSIRRAIIGFDSYEDAKKLADKYGLDVQHFSRRDGWQLWYRTGHTAYGAYDYEQVWRDEVNADIDVFKPGEEGDVMDNLKYFLQDCTNLGNMRSYIDNTEKVLDALNGCEDNQFVVTLRGELEGVYESRVMSYSYDTHQYVIGICE